MTPIDRRGGHQRVAFEQAVQLLGAGAPCLWARSANLSETGIFVSCSRPLAVGTEIELRLPLAEGARPLCLRGRVVRVCDNPTPGMGIVFVELAEAEAEALRRAVRAAVPLGWTRVAKAWFAGTSQPTRVQVRFGPDGLRLFCDLGFLRLGMPVTLCFPEEDREERFDGVLQAANLCIDPEQQVPRLELAVDIDEETPDAGARTWTYWPPPPLASAEGEGAEADAEEPVLVELAEEGDSRKPPVPEAARHPRGGSVEELDLRAGSTSLAEPPRSVSGSIAARVLPSPPLRPEPSVEAPSLCSSVEPGPSGSPAPDGGEAGWDFGLPEPAAQSHWSLKGSELAPPRSRKWRRRARFWLWLLALSMAALTVASMVHTRLWQRVSDKLLLPEGSLQPASFLPEPEPAEAAGEATPVVVPSDAKAAASPPADPPPRGEASGGVEPSLQVDSSTLTIPIEGSVNAARHYRLARPEGVAVNLPHARPRVRFGDYRVQRGGFRVVWVRKRALGGLHLRVLHDSGRVPELRVGPSAVRVILHPATGGRPAAGQGEALDPGDRARPSEGDPAP